jgi:hypothetical protein
MVRQVLFSESQILRRPKDFPGLHFENPINQIEAHTPRPLPNFFPINSFKLLPPMKREVYKQPIFTATPNELPHGTMFGHSKFRPHRNSVVQSLTALFPNLGGETCW